MHRVSRIVRRSLLIFGTAATISLRQLGLYTDDLEVGVESPIVRIQFRDRNPSDWDPNELVRVNGVQHVVAWEADPDEGYDRLARRISLN